MYAGDVVVGQIDTWTFNTNDTAYDAARTQLLDFDAGDLIEIKQSSSRHQTITLTSTPTSSFNIVTVNGRADRGTSSQVPSPFADVTITLTPGPLQGVDYTARAAADAAQADIDTHEASTHNTDANARTAAAAAHAAANTAQGDIDSHEANHPSGGGDDAYEWATEGNTDAIPADKLTNAPSGAPTLTEVASAMVGDADTSSLVIGDTQTGVAIRGAWNSGTYWAFMLDIQWELQDMLDVLDYSVAAIMPIRRRIATNSLNIPFVFDEHSTGFEWAAEAGLLTFKSDNSVTLGSTTDALRAGARVKLYGMS